MVASKKWAFKTKFRTNAYGWRGSRLAVSRLKVATSEIRAAAKSDPVVDGEGVDALEAYTRAEPVPYSDFMIQRTRLLAHQGRGNNDPGMAAEFRRLMGWAQSGEMLVQRQILERALEKTPSA